MSKTEIAWVLGGSGGIGEAICDQLARDGKTVVLSYYSHPEKAEEIAKRIGPSATALFTDVTDPASVRDAHAAIERSLGPVSDLVYCAGLAESRLFQDASEEEMLRMTEVNLIGAYRAIRESLPGMISQKRGNILLISSMWGEVGASCEALYSSAKAGLIGLCKALAKELGPSGIRVNCLSPGVIDTAMVRPLGEETLKELAFNTPLGRLGTPEDVAQCASFLLSDRASFVTGQILGIDGGYVL